MAPQHPDTAAPGSVEHFNNRTIDITSVAEARQRTNQYAGHSKGLPTFGTLVISLDFELHWGIRDIEPANGSYRQTMLKTRQVVPRLLHLFEEFDIAATWATVGLLFAQSREEALHYMPAPALQPAYHNTILSPYDEPLGQNEEEDPVHFAASLIRLIRQSPRQEIGTHTFSHYYCLEPGQTRATFRADLESAVAIAKSHNLELRSIVFPRNQLNPSYMDVLHEFGITCYRQTEKGWMYDPAPTKDKQHLFLRGTRLLDSYLNVSGLQLTDWQQVPHPDGLCEVPASAFLRAHKPYLRHLEMLRLRRIVHSIEAAAANGKIFHLWWHPQDFGNYTDENLHFLRIILEAFARCRERYGMKSLSMGDVASRAQTRVLVLIVVMLGVSL
jgi:peptidoglycan/xylan/chitin deacetylase (PgdA/CDA1 family)